MYYTYTRTWKFADYLSSRRALSSERASAARARARAVITFYFKDGRGSFAILCRTSICLIYRNYTYTDPVRFCHNLYPEYRRIRVRLRSPVCVCACMHRVFSRWSLARALSRDHETTRESRREEWPVVSTSRRQ